jgi:hypothetical protein
MPAHSHPEAVRSENFDRGRVTNLVRGVVSRIEEGHNHDSYAFIDFIQRSPRYNPRSRRDSTYSVSTHH